MLNPNLANVKFRLHITVLSGLPPFYSNRNVIYIHQDRVNHLELTLGYMGTFFNNGSMTTKFHILNEQEGLGGHANDRRWVCVI